MNSLPSKSNILEEFIGTYRVQNRSVYKIHEDSSPGVTHKLSKGCMFGGESADSEDIDLVCLWCDGSDPKWLKKRNTWRNNLKSDLNEQAISECRFTDNEELKYLLRSVELYASWIRKIFIVTDDQTPHWLNTDNPKILVVDHKEFIPKSILPTFNSNTIEAYLPFIPGLSERFLYANDDTMFNAPVSKDFFYDPSGYPIVRLIKKISSRALVRQLYARTISNMIHKINKKFKLNLDIRYSHHNIDAYLKSDFLRCIEEFKDEYETWTKNKFRSENDFQRVLISYYGIAKNRAIPKVIKSWRRILFGIFSKLCEADSIMLSICKKDLSTRLKKSNPKLFCINDMESATSYDRQKARQFLTERFLNKSSFENTTES